MRITNNSNFIILIIAFVFYFSSENFSQDSSRSLAFRHPINNNPNFIFRPSDVSYNLYEGFILMQKANAGDPIAQHELGIRYLLGEGFESDTSRSFYWIKKAADQGLETALYNVGIFYNNGWGVDWNPFIAFKYFLQSAEKGFAQAQFVIGIIYTEDIIVPKNLIVAYKWLKKASAQNNERAKEILTQLEKKGITSDDSDLNSNKKLNANSNKQSQSNSNYQLNYIDFSADTSATINDSLLVDDLIKVDEELKKSMDIEVINNSSIHKITSVDEIEKKAEIGNPESLTLLGRMYENGINVDKNVIKSASLYIRAYLLESFRAFKLLVDLIQQKEFYPELKREIDLKNPEAFYVWATLSALKFDYQITNEDALRFLQLSISQNYLPAYLEMGRWYYNGTFVKKDINKTIEYWEEASNKKSSEAKIRLIILNFTINENSNFDKNTFKFLEEQEKEGSILAQIALAYFYEKGIVVKKNKANAVELYRQAAFRGSQIAYNALKNLYDELRPNDPMFEIN